MNINNQVSLYGILGSPISHSISPFIHNFAFKFNKIDCAYHAFNVPSENLEKAVDAIKVLNIKGSNITIPHKKNIIPFLNDISPEAKYLQSVNTIKNENGFLTGYCTDYYGFIQKFTIENINYRSANILIIGSGGSATAIIRGLLLVDNINSVSIAARNIAAALEIKNNVLTEYPQKNIDIYDIASDDIDKKMDKFDIIVQTTPLGMKGNLENQTPLKSTFLKPSQIVYDIIYNPLKTKLLIDAEMAGCKTFNGLDMLMYQAAKSFNIWTQKELPIEIIKQEILKSTIVNVL